MNNLLEHETISSPLSSRKQFPSHRHRLLRFFLWATVGTAFVAGIILLLSDVLPTPLLHAPVSAAPLVLIGSTYLGFQVLIRPKPLDLFKALIVSAAFLLWGVDQLLPTGWFATTLGDLVIVLYVIDLGWMMVDRLQRKWKRHKQRGTRPFPTERNASSSQWGARTPLLHLDSSTPKEKQRVPHPIIMVSRESTSFFKRHRLVSLPCTCASPLDHLRSPTCCRETQEVS